MYSYDTELLFPPKIIPTLRGLRGRDWANLIDQIDQSVNDDLVQIAFVLLMVRMNGCMTCSSDSYKAMRGCYRCSSLSIHWFPGTYLDLNRLYRDALNEMEDYIEHDEKI